MIPGPAPNGTMSCATSKWGGPRPRHDEFVESGQSPGVGEPAGVTSSVRQRIFLRWSFGPSEGGFDMNERMGLGALLVCACAVACGGGEAAQECVPGDASKPAFTCSPAGQWVATAATGGTGTQSGQSSTGGEASSLRDGAGADAGGTTRGIGGTGGDATGGANNGVPGTGGRGGTGDGGSQGSVGSPQCLTIGEPNCSDSAPCCDGSLCITDGVSVACAALCSSGDECVSGCCAPVDETSSVCAPTSFCPPPVAGCTANGECETQCCFPLDAQTSACAPASLCAPPASVDCANLVLLANDGTFLGQASSNAFAADSVCNEFGQYGSQFSSTSIFNQFGSYGSPFAVLSAYNEFTSTPPVLYCGTTNTLLNPVSKNTVIAGAIDPDALCAVLTSNGL
jgi:hypothetical protein